MNATNTIHRTQEQRENLEEYRNKETYAGKISGTYDERGSREFDIQRT